ncbi:MAG: hypothetical protein IKJ30_00350, partial [Bacilli bacterium]|nr:hypothetical protein [Bacilli bacterium]
MKTYSNSLNRIFKSPLFKGLLIVFAFLFICLINNETIYASTTEWDSGSGATYTNGEVRLTRDDDPVFYIYGDTDGLTLGNNHFEMYIDGVYVNEIGSSSLDGSYENGWLKITVSRTATSISAYAGNNPSSGNKTYVYATIPYSKIVGKQIKVTHFTNYFGPSFEATVVDKAPPNITGMTPGYILDSSSDWTNGSVAMSVKGAEDGAGIGKYEYSYDKSTWYNDWVDYDYTKRRVDYTYASGVWTAERNNYVYFRACDKLGNCSGASSTSLRVRIDTTAPSSSVTVNNPSGGNWTTQDVVLTLSGGADSGSVMSGFSKYQYSYDNSSWTDGSGWTKNGNTWKGTWSAERNDIVYFRVCDVAGNCSSTSGTTTYIRIDRTAPTLTIGSPSTGVIRGSGTSTVYVSKAGATISISFTENIGLQYYDSTSYYRYKWCTSSSSCSGSWISVGTSRAATSVSGTVTAPTTGGTHYLWIEGDARDLAGNYVSNSTNVGGITSSSATDRKFNVLVDTEHPVLSIGNVSTGITEGSGTSTVYYAGSNQDIFIDFTDNGALLYYDSTSYFRYGWSTSSTSSPSWTSVNASSGNRSITRVYGYVKTPTTQGTHYLWIEGDARDYMAHYMSNSTNIGGVASTASTNRVFKFIVDTTAPTLSIGTPSSGSVVGSGTSTTYYAQSNKSLTVTFTDNYYLINHTSTSYYRYGWTTSSTSTPSYTSIGTSRAKTSVSGSITTPSTAGVHYLWIEGDVRDAANIYMSNSTNINGTGTTSSSARIFKFIIDNTAPTMSTFYPYGTVGDDGYRYVTGNSFTLYSYYSDNYGVKTATLPSICSTSSTTTGVSSSTKYITSSCNTSSYSVSYTTKRSLSMTLTDYAGNTTTRTVDYYKIDTTRKVTIDDFNLKGVGSYADGWIGSQETTGGGLIPVYDLSNASYLSPYKYLYMYDEYNYSYYVTLLSWESHSSGDSVYYEDTTYLYDMFYYLKDSGYSPCIEFGVKNIYGQETYYYLYELYYDFDTPWLDMFSINSGSYTYGDNGGYYFTGDSLELYYDIYDDSSNLHTDTVLVSSGITYDKSDMYYYGYNYYGNLYIDISGLPVDFTSEKYIYYYVFDIAGNMHLYTFYFYKIDSSRDIGISNFAVRGKSSNVDNYVGSKAITAGNVAPIYTLSNTTYLSTKYMQFYVGLTSTSSTTSTYRFVYAYSTANITSTISSGTYINIASGYSGTSTTVDTWYSNIATGSTRYGKIMFKNIYGRVTTATVSVIFDYTAPTISTFTVTGNSGARTGYTNTRNVTYNITASDTYLYDYFVYHTDDNSQMSYSTSKPTSGTITQTYEGTHELGLRVEDRAGNATYSYYSIVLDTVLPTVSMSITSGTVGKNGYRYVVGNTAKFSVSYTDNTSGAYSIGVSTGCTHTLTAVVGSKSGTETCDITSDAINFDSRISRSITVTDYAGNSKTASVSFYKIDNTRKITVSNFYVRGRGAFVNNWIGSRYTTQGDVAAYYTMGNSQYLDDSYLYFSPTGMSSFIYASNVAGITDIIASGNYVNIVNEYSSYTSVDEWYDYELYYIMDEYQYEYYYYPNIDFKNIYGQYTYTYSEDPIMIDEIDPELNYAYFSYDCTIGTNGSYYTLGSYFDIEAEYYDYYAYDYMVTGPSGLTYDNSYSVYQDSYEYLYFSVDLTSVTVSFDTARTVCFYIYDNAGNYSSYCESFYKIDTSRDIKIASFGVKGYSSQTNNYIGPKSLTSGKVAPIYTLENADYIYNNYMMFYVGLTSSGSTTSTYRFVYQTNKSNIVTTVTSGTYITVASGHSGTSTTVDTWYSNIADAASRYAKITFKNIYGRIVTSSVNIKFDYTSPTITGYSVTGNAAAQNGYTNQRAITLSYTPADTNLYRYTVYDNGTQIKTDTTKVTSATLANSTNGTHTVKLRVYDKAGNYVETSKNMILDTVIPVSEFELSDNRTITMNFNDSYISTNKSLGSKYLYYMSLKSNVDVNALSPSDFIVPVGNDLTNASDIPMNIAKQKHYLYVVTNETPRDRAGNFITCYDTADNITHPAYDFAFNGCVIKTLVEGDENSSNVSMEPSKFTSNNANINDMQVIHVDGMIIVTFFTETTVSFNLETINDAIYGTGYAIQTINNNNTYTFTKSGVYHDVLVSKIATNQKSNANELLDLVIVIAAPNVADNAAVNDMVINEGEELGNIAVAFISDIEFSVDTIITLDGIKVKEVDANRPGVYEVRSIARDIMGRVNKVNRTIVVKEGVKEEVEVKVEEIKETPEVITPVVVNNAPVEVQPEVNTNRKVVENIQV